ncbi:MAG: hypothetical protein QXL57_03510 [Candidatus Bathyarchaeia archaeon]
MRAEKAYLVRLRLLERFLSEKFSYLRRVCISSDICASEKTSTVLREFPPGLLPTAVSVELALYTGYIEPYDPLSMLIIAPVGSGKTELLKAYTENRGIALYNDFTSYGLTGLLGQIQAGLIRHVMVADLVRLTARGNPVWHQILLTLNALIEEGVQNIDTFHIRFHSPTPVKAGVITALTTDEWKARRKQWIRLGFLSRAVPISYHIAPEDIIRGEQALYRAEPTFKPVKLDFPEKPVCIAIPEKHKEALMRLGRVIAAVNRDETRFRSHRHVLAMAKASALRGNRTEVDESDVKLLKALSVLWLSPYSGDEPSFRIMLTLPATPNRILDALSSLYSPATIYRRLNYLEHLKAIKREGDEWIPNL